METGTAADGINDPRRDALEIALGDDSVDAKKHVQWWNSELEP